MEQTYLPGKIRDRIQDLMKANKVTQAELAARIGCSESMLSRFISGKTDKLGDENIIRIARVFNVSTDFLLGEVDIPDRLNYDISELGLSVQAARNLYTHKVNPKVVNALLENPEFANTTNLISGYLDDELAKGFAAQNQLYATVAGMLRGQPEVDCSYSGYYLHSGGVSGQLRHFFAGFGAGTGLRETGTVTNGSKCSLLYDRGEKDVPDLCL